MLMKRYQLTLKLVQNQQLKKIKQQKLLKNQTKTVETSKKVTTEEDKETETTTSKVSSNKSNEKTLTKTLKTEDEINYYVSDSKGLDSNDGSIDKPFKTIGHAVELTTDSSTYNIYIKEGTYKGVGNTNLTVSGTNKINFIGDGINKTIFDGEANYTVGGSTV